MTLLVAGALLARQVATLRPRAPGATLAAVGGWTLLCLGPWRAHLPAAWITVLQEGFAGDTLDRVAGGGLHGLPGQAVVVSALTGGPTIRDVVAVNLWLTGLLAVALVHVASRWAGGVGLALVAGWALLPHTWSTALSMQPGPLTSALLLAALLPASGRHGLGTTGRVGLLVLLTALVATLRVELTALPGLAALVVAVSEAAPGAAARAEAAASRGAAWVARPRGTLLVGGVALGWALAAPRLEPLVPGLVRWPPGVDHVVWALSPLNVAWITAPTLLLAVVPLGATLLAVRGLGRSLAAPVTTAGVAVAVVVLYQAYFVAAHGRVFHPRGALSVPEMYRYLGLLAPVLVALAAWGAASLPARGRLPWVLLALLPPLPEAAHLLPQHRPAHDPRTAPLPRVGLVDADVQRQVRAVVAALDDRPGCAVLTRGRRWSSSPEAPVIEDVLLFPRPRGGWSTRRLAPVEGLGLERLEDLGPDACLLVLVSTDCDLAGGQVPCEGLADGLPLVHEEVFPVRPWVFADHTGGWAGTHQRFALHLAPVPPPVAARQGSPGGP